MSFFARMIAWYVGSFRICILRGTPQRIQLHPASRNALLLQHLVQISQKSLPYIRHRPRPGDDSPAKLPSAFATVSSLNRFSCGNRTRAIATVSTIVNSSHMADRACWQFSSIKLISKDALCATITHPSQNARNSGRISAMVGASMHHVRR